MKSIRAQSNICSSNISQLCCVEVLVVEQPYRSRYMDQYRPSLVWSNVRRQVLQAFQCQTSCFFFVLCVEDMQIKLVYFLFGFQYIQTLHDISFQMAWHSANLSSAGGGTSRPYHRTCSILTLFASLAVRLLMSAVISRCQHDHNNLYTVFFQKRLLLLLLYRLIYSGVSGDLSKN